MEKATKEQIEEIYANFKNDIDKDGDGLVTFEEFLAFMSTYGWGDCPDEVKMMFDEFDIDGDGKIHLEEYVTQCLKGLEE